MAKPTSYIDNMIKSYGENWLVAMSPEAIQRSAKRIVKEGSVELKKIMYDNPNNFELKSKVEAVLFVTSKTLQAEDIAVILGVDKEQVEEALLELIMDYSARDGALEIDDEDGYILQVKAEHMDIVELLCPIEIKPAVLKTLTVIALKQPIRQSYLKELRGASAYEHVAELLEKGMISKNKDKNGRSFNLRTTKKFEEYFKLKGDTKSLAKILEIDKGVKD